MQVENLRCLRDPDCERHSPHGGHLRKLGSIDPRISYEIRQRRKYAGRRAWGMIRAWQKYHKKIGLTSSERHSLFVFVRDALIAEHLFS